MPQFRRLLTGNGISQKGLIQYFEGARFEKEILLLLAEFSDLLKNPNYKCFEESFAKTKPKDLASCRLGEMM